MLESLNHQTIGAQTLRVQFIGQPRFFDQRDFELYLDARLIFRGKYNAGRPSIYVPAWIDGEFVEETPIADDLAQAIASKLGTLIPPGGRMWFAYEAFGVEGALMRETRQALVQNLPLITTPLGFLLFRADCWCGLRDWHIPEGGREGPRKLQGNKAINAEHARQRASAILSELETFLRRDTQTKIEREAHARAIQVSKFLHQIPVDSNS
jgi:hypothetical protein